MQVKFLKCLEFQSENIECEFCYYYGNDSRKFLHVLNLIPVFQCFKKWWKNVKAATSLERDWRTMVKENCKKSVTSNKSAWGKSHTLRWLSNNFLVVYRVDHCCGIFKLLSCHESYKHEFWGVMEYESFYHICHS